MYQKCLTNEWDFSFLTLEVYRKKEGCNPSLIETAEPLDETESKMELRLS